MNELIETHENESGDVLVSGRELHEFLGVSTQYTKWFERMTEYGFVNNQDYIAISQKRLTAQGNSTEFTDHHMKLDMAKEISMIQRTDKGKEARQYFLQIERYWNSPEMITKRAMQILNSNLERLKLENEELKPKAIFADAVSASKTSILVGDLAKLLKQNGISIGAGRLFDYLRTNGYLIRKKGTSWNMPTQRSMEMKLFEIKETVIARSDGNPQISKTTKVTGKGQRYFINHFLSKEESEVSKG